MQICWYFCFYLNTTLKFECNPTQNSILCQCEGTDMALYVCTLDNLAFIFNYKSNNRHSKLTARICMKYKQSKKINPMIIDCVCVFEPPVAHMGSPPEEFSHC
jgi:hypothetical protein